MPESSISCPICEKPVALSDPLAPFCSERCRLLDLGNWASGRYAIPASRAERRPADEAFADLASQAEEDGGE
jgi:endogenous inhibitor of DNA gyrase (YacG/DUF329 family)